MTRKIGEPGEPGESKTEPLSMQNIDKGSVIENENGKRFTVQQIIRIPGFEKDGVPTEVQVESEDGANIWLAFDKVALSRAVEDWKKYKVISNPEIEK